MGSTSQSTANFLHMSTEITLHTEVRIAGKWHHYAQPVVRSDRQLFARMANIENGLPGHKNFVEPISEPKGLPNELSDVTRLDSTSRQWKHASYLNRYEIKQLQDWMDGDHHGRPRYRYEHRFDNTFGCLFENSYVDLDDPELIPSFVEDIRFVFWFSEDWEEGPTSPRKG